MRLATPEEIFREIRGAQVLREEITDDGRHTHLSNGKLLVTQGRKVVSYEDDE